MKPLLGLHGDNFIIMTPPVNSCNALAPCIFRLKNRMLPITFHPGKPAKLRACIHDYKVRSIILFGGTSARITMRWDLKAFESMKAVDYRRYKNLKSILRFNGFLCILLCLSMMVSALFHLGDEPGWKIFLVVVLFGAGLVVAIRWWVWSWKKD